MPRYTPVDLDFEPYIGPSARSTQVFVYDNSYTHTSWPLGKLPKIGEGRQRHFVEQLVRLSAAVGSYCIPIHIEWRNHIQNQMDKGCIGHSFGPDSAIASVAINHLDEVTHVILRENFNAPNY
jgi:hypothetical protein